MFKIVLQIPELESEVLIEPWQETSDPHGPHIKIYRGQPCAETGAPMTFVRCKHRTVDSVHALMTKVLSSVQSLSEEEKHE